MPSVSLGKADVQRWVSTAGTELTVLRDQFRERGYKFFIRPLGMAGAAMLVGYYYVYLPPLARASKVAVELGAAQATAQYAEDYKNLTARLDGLYTKLPRTDDPQGWILAEVRKTLRQEGIVPLSISTPTDAPRGEYRFISIQVRCQANYPQIASWISRLERNESILFVSELILRKESEPIGSNTLDVTITTVVPKGGA
ncbi:MAG: type 4a pilus biogenesis protein PilO [Elusimicrobia bacterium]|nr:type 4a pilus biogenesis protein PilO [Elusimicrobiota bacterium]